MKLIKSFKIFENIQQAKSVLRNSEVSENDKDYQTILKWFTGKEGYIGWFTKMRHEKKIPLSSLKSIYDLIISNQNLVRSLPKQLTTYDEFESLQDDIEKTKSLTDVKKCYNEFPSLQKSFLNIKDDKVFNLLKSLYSLKNFKDYFNKVSRYKNKEILIDSIKSFIEGNSKNNDFDEILRSISMYIRRGDCEMTHKDIKNDVIIIRCFDYSVVRNLGSGTSWCIRDPSTFKSYVPDRDAYQYMIWLTDMPVWSNYSLIGLTLNKNGFRTAHLKDDHSISLENLYKLLDDRHFNIKKLYSVKEVNYNYSVSELRFLFNLSDDEILKNKKKFNYGELFFFKKEILKKFGITQQYLSSLSLLLSKGYTKEDIIENKRNFDTYDMEYLEESDIRKIGLEYFPLKCLIDRIPLDEILKDKKEVDDPEEFRYIKPENIVKYDLGLDNINMQYMIKGDRYYRNDTPIEYSIPLDYIISHKNEWNMYDFSYFNKDVDKSIIENILLNKEILGVLNNEYNVLEFIDKSYIIKNKLWEKVSMSISYLSKREFVIDDIKKYNMEDIYWGSDVYGKEYPKDRVEISLYIDGKYKDYEWQKVNKFIEDLGFDSSRYRSDKVDNDALFNMLKFYNYNLIDSKNFYSKLEVSRYDTELLFKIIDDLIKKGLDLEKDDFSELIKNVSNRNHNVSTINYIKVIIHYKIKSLYKDVFKLTKENKIEYHIIQGLEGLGFDKELADIKNREDVNKARNVLSRLYSSTGARDSTPREMNEVYELFSKKIIHLKWVEKENPWDEDKELIGLFYVLVHLDKLDEFDKDKFLFDNKTLKCVYRVLCGTSRSNSRNKCGVPLTKEDNERAYKWLKQNYILPSLSDWEGIRSNFTLPITYLYDKELFNKILDKFNKGINDLKNDKRFDGHMVFFNFLLSTKLITDEEALSECKNYYNKLNSLIKTKMGKKRFFKKLLSQSEFGHISDRKYKLEEYLKSLDEIEFNTYFRI